jgi:hypothetical protein
VNSRRHRTKSGVKEEWSIGNIEYAKLREREEKRELKLTTHRNACVELMFMETSSRGFSPSKHLKVQ